MNTPTGKFFTDSQERYIEHEVRIRSIEGSQARFEETFKSIDQKFDKLTHKIDDHFKWFIGSILTVILVIIAAKFI